MSTMTQDNALATIVQQGGLDIAKAGQLIDTLSPFVAEAGDLIREAAGITVTDATQVTQIKAARATRLKLRAVRVKAEEARKSLKSDALKTGQIIDKCANWIKERIEPEEARLQECEDFAERAEGARKAALKASREILLAPFGVDTSYVNLGELADDKFARLLEDSRLAHEARAEAARKQEAERVAAEAARVAEQARLAAENERLRLERAEAEKAAKAERDRAAAEAAAAAEKARKEREAVEAKAAAERAAHEAVLRKEREAREQLERDAATQKAEAVRKAAAEAAAKRAAERAPDKVKLLAWASALAAVPVPEMTTHDGKCVLSNVQTQIDKAIAFVTERASTL